MSFLIEIWFNSFSDMFKKTMIRDFYNNIFTQHYSPNRSRVKETARGRQTEKLMSKVIFFICKRAQTMEVEPCNDAEVKSLNTFKNIVTSYLKSPNSLKVCFLILRFG